MRRKFSIVMIDGNFHHLFITTKESTILHDSIRLLLKASALPLRLIFELHINAAFETYLKISEVTTVRE